MASSIIGLLHVSHVLARAQHTTAKLQLQIKGLLCIFFRSVQNGSHHPAACKRHPVLRLWNVSIFICMACRCNQGSSSQCMKVASERPILLLGFASYCVLPVPQCLGCTCGVWSPTDASVQRSQVLTQLTYLQVPICAESMDHSGRKEAQLRAEDR